MGGAAGSRVGEKSCGRKKLAFLSKKKRQRVVVAQRRHGACSPSESIQNLSL